jgi:hypothetical protein
MEGLFKQDVVLVRERVGYFKAANAYDLFDEQGQKTGEVLEDVPGGRARLLQEGAEVYKMENDAAVYGQLS